MTTRASLLLAATALLWPSAGFSIPQPPHDAATHGVTCADCHVPYGALNDPAQAAGAAGAGSGPTTLVDASKSWSADAWVDGVVTVLSGANRGKFRTIVANDATSLTWETALPFPVATGDLYRIGKTTELDIETRCTSCHNPTGQAASMADVSVHLVRGGRVVGCGKCHDPHNIEPNSGAGHALVRVAPRWPTVREPIAFPSGNPANPFVDAAAPYAGVCEGCHTQTAYHRNNASGNHTHNAGGACTQCHSHKANFAPAGCDGCHEAPPPTGAHLKHYAGPTDGVGYGSTTGAGAGSTGYAFNCGVCHPIDFSHHANGVANVGGGAAEVDLSPLDAPAGSLKALNPPSASYTPGGTVRTDARGFAYTEGTCSNVYCHSRSEVSVPGPVAEPGSAGLPFTGYPVSYPPFAVDRVQVYESPSWGGGALGCAGCHAYPPRTEYTSVVAGAGDSHSWIDDWGYEDLHGWAHGWDPIACGVCHHDTVTERGVRSRDANEWSVYAPVPIAGFERHVNGQADVAFDPVPVTFSNPQDLTAASYDPVTRTCLSVACHQQETSAPWGQPYRWWNSTECNVCHRN